jgi:hypothetical protein
MIITSQRSSSQARAAPIGICAAVSPAYSRIRVRTLLETGQEARDLWGRHEIVLPRRHSAIRVRHDRGAVEASTMMTSLSPRTWLMVAWLPEGLQPPGW